MSVRGAAITVLLLSSALAGCDAFRTSYVRPDVTGPTTYPHDDVYARALLDHWWENFKDPNLNAIVSEALRANPNLALAALNIRSASLQTHLAVINPAISAGYTYAASKPLNGSASTNQFHSLTASASYEVDLWGELAAERDVAHWEEKATIEDRESAALLLIGAAVNLYFEIANLNESIALWDANIADAEKALRLIHVLKSAGSATALDLAMSEQALESQRASQAQLIEQRVEQRNALRVLLAGTPWPIAKERKALPVEPPPAVDAGLPASLLDRRPDLRAAELRLRETLAQTDATRLSFYPNLSLTGSVGTASTGLSEIVSNPLGSLAASLTTPFVQWNQAHFATALARTQYDKAIVSFRETLLQALIDVDNALSARKQLAEEGEQLERSLGAANTAEHLYENLYRAGSVALRSWLDAQEARRQSEVSLSGNRLQRLQNYATLCQALGGGADRL